MNFTTSNIIIRYLRLSCKEVKYSWMFLNDCILSTKILDTNPAVIASACLYLGIRYSQKRKNYQNGIDYYHILKSGVNNTHGNGTYNSSESNNNEQRVESTIPIPITSFHDDGDDVQVVQHSDEWWEIFGITKSEIFSTASWIVDFSVNPS